MFRRNLQPSKACKILLHLVLSRIVGNPANDDWNEEKNSDLSLINYNFLTETLEILNGEFITFEYKDH